MECLTSVYMTSFPRCRQCPFRWTMVLDWLGACARNARRPPEGLDAWLPWRMSAEHRRTVEQAPQRWWSPGARDPDAAQETGARALRTGGLNASRGAGSALRASAPGHVLWPAAADRRHPPHRPQPAAAEPHRAGPPRLRVPRVADAVRDAPHPVPDAPAEGSGVRRLPDPPATPRSRSRPAAPPAAGGAHRAPDPGRGSAGQPRSAPPEAGERSRRDRPLQRVDRALPLPALLPRGPRRASARLPAVRLRGPPPAGARQLDRLPHAPPVRTVTRMQTGRHRWRRIG